jgi:hypothetical protein
MELDPEFDEYWIKILKECEDYKEYRYQKRKFITDWISTIGLVLIYGCIVFGVLYAIHHATTIKDNSYRSIPYTQ